GSAGQGSQASPLPSMSPSAWSLFGTDGQLSAELVTPSESWSLGSTDMHIVVLALRGQTSQASPSPSESKSACLPLSTGRIGLNTVGQLSIASSMPSPSESVAVATPV